MGGVGGRAQTRLYRWPALVIRLGFSKLHEVVLLGAHCDDIAIGAGATLLALSSDRPGLRVRTLVMTGGGSSRADEEHAALEEFLPSANRQTTILDLPDGRLPQHWDLVKVALNDLARTCRPDLVLAPQRDDAHQDHRLIAELAPTAFRDHLILSYEILKWESDLLRAVVYHPVSPEHARLKADLLVKHYPSQSGHDWFDREAFLGMMRIRGAQCHDRYAEGFVAEKMLLDLG